MIKAKNIHKSFGDLEVLRGVDLSVGKGEIVSIVGPSGAGKTTLLQILGTLDKPNEGEVQVDGIDFSKLNSNELSAFRNRHIGFIFQFHQLLPEFTAIENVIIPALIGKTNVRLATERAVELLNFLQLGDRLQHKPAELSGGEKQRVAIARALINDPLIIMCDEPTGNLDSKNADIVFNIFKKLTESHDKTILVVTHDLNFANSTGRIIELDDGRIVRM